MSVNSERDKVRNLSVKRQKLIFSTKQTQFLIQSEGNFTAERMTRQCQISSAEIPSGTRRRLFKLRRCTAWGTRRKRRSMSHKEHMNLSQQKTPGTATLSHHCQKFQTEVFHSKALSFSSICHVLWLQVVAACSRARMWGMPLSDPLLLPQFSFT